MARHGEDLFRNRAWFKLTGWWPRSVVESRLATTTYDPSNVNAIMQSIWDEAGRGDEYVPLTGREHLGG